MYLPFAQRYEPFLTVAAPSTGNATDAARAVREAFRRTDPDLAVEVIGTGREILSGPFVFLRAAGTSAVNPNAALRHL